MSNIEDIKRKIEAMLAKANDTGATEEEADAFNRKAHELMLKYNIERAELGSKEAVERIHLTLEVQLRPWSQAVLYGITQLYFCKYFSQKLDPKGRKHRITIIGEKQNASVCHAISVMVLRSIQQEARHVGDGRSFMTGAGYRVHERCEEMMDYSNRTAQLPQTKLLGSAANALVVLKDEEQEANDNYVEDILHIKLITRKPRSAKVRDISAFDRGQAHGNKVQLRRNLLT